MFARRVSVLILILASLSAPWCLFAADTGSISGTVDLPDRLTGAMAVDRQAEKTFAGKTDRASGAFTIEGLPLGRTYDLILDTPQARLEGVNLRVPVPDAWENEPLTTDDIETLKTKVKNIRQFEDTVDVLAIEGNLQYAAVVVNKLRTEKFMGSGPNEVIWRLEIWHFERPDDTWAKVQDELFVLHYRERLMRDAYDRKSLSLDPALGGIHIVADQHRVILGKVALPAADPGIRIRDSRPAALPAKAPSHGE